MSFDELKEKALSLPYAPGVYIMRNKDDKVIYVGKAKKLKNRVSQYFQDTASHSPKTRIMVSHIHHFDVIVAASEFEALVLECSLIKRYSPKYNILLKDDKGYPFVRLSQGPYPRFSLVNRMADDGGRYFGPFGGRHETRMALEAIPNMRLLTPHSCRHTYVSQMQALGVDLSTIQSIVGHADMNMTQHYLHVQESIRTDAVDRFSKAFPTGHINPDDPNDPSCNVLKFPNVG